MGECKGPGRLKRLAVTLAVPIAGSVATPTALLGSHYIKGGRNADLPLFGELLKDDSCDAPNLKELTEVGSEGFIVDRVITELTPSNTQKLPTISVDKGIERKRGETAQEVTRRTLQILPSKLLKAADRTNLGFKVSDEEGILELRGGKRGRAAGWFTDGQESLGDKLEIVLGPEYTKNPTVILHELGHFMHWDMCAEKSKVLDKREVGGEGALTEEQKLSFFVEYGGENQREDFATMFEAVISISRDQAVDLVEAGQKSQSFLEAYDLVAGVVAKYGFTNEWIAGYRLLLSEGWSPELCEARVITASLKQAISWLDESDLNLYIKGDVLYVKNGNAITQIGVSANGSISMIGVDGVVTVFSTSISPSEDTIDLLRRSLASGATGVG